MARRRRKKLSNRQSILVTFLFLLGSALLGTWVFSDGLRDAQDPTWVRCEVVDAKSQRGGRHATVPWYVMVQTSDCGKILYLVGTREENVEGLAATFEPGPYEFKLGALSQRRIEGDTFLDLAPVAKDIRRLPTEPHT
jgi:hypothetical protein